MNSLMAGWSADDTITAIALLGAAVAFVVGLFQYRKAQRWKRAEWVAQEVKALLADPSVDAALKMIDWGGREVLVYPAREVQAQRFEAVTSDETTRALMHHSKRPPFSPKEAGIRDAFDRLFDGLERLSGYVASGLITTEDLAPYLDYWALHISKPEGNPRLLQVRSYMRDYGFAGTERLLRLLAEASMSEPRAADEEVLQDIRVVPSPVQSPRSNNNRVVPGSGRRAATF